MIIFLIPYHKTGGAEKVHSEIIKAVSSRSNLIIIFEYTDGSPISHLFTKYPYVNLANSKIRKLLCLALIMVLSRVLQLTIFGCNTPLFYRLLPMVSPKTIKIDLTHAFSYPAPGVEEVSKHYVPLISTRIVINHKTLEDYQDQYVREGISLDYIQHFQVIPAGVYINNFDDQWIDERFNNFTIGYVGRFAQEKRPELFLELSKMDFDIKFGAKMITDRFEDASSKYAGLNLILGITDPAQVRKEFSTISVLIITSEREGFPLTVMEAMELGIPVISANVGSIHEHVINDFNGYVFDVKDKESFLISCRQKIETMASDKKLYTELCLNARQHALEHFDIKDMHKAYRKLLLNE